MKQFSTIFTILLLAVSSHPLASANIPRKNVLAKAIHNDVPSGYTRLGTTDLFFCRKQGGIDAGSVSIGSIDLIGKFGNQYYSSTYHDNGYVVAMQVSDGTAQFMDCLNGSTLDGVQFHADIEQQGEMAKISYRITNTNDMPVSICLGAYDDAYVGDAIDATIVKKKDSNGNPYGISLSDRQGAQLCVLFGAGLIGVTGADDYWFGSYSLNTSAYAMSGHYSSGSDYMVENSQYDCGIGWCWKDRVIPSGETRVFSYLIAIGDVNLEPNSSFEVTPDDPDGWNDLSRPHRLTLEGEYESPAGQNGKIQYAVEDSENWLDLTDEIESGSSFTASLVAMFDASKDTHTIRFRTIDAVGNTSMLSPITYKDVSYQPITGIEEKVYNWGDSIYQTNLMCDLPSDQYSIADYRNNVNAGVAAFNIEGVFPYSIGKKAYNFTIKPLPLDGQLQLEQDYFVYNGSQHCPTWSFTNDVFDTMEVDTDYSILWSNNVVPGTAELRIIGKGNFSNELSANFFIDKAQLNTNLYTVSLPKEDVTFDDTQHGAYVSISEGVGTPTIYYSLSGDDSLSETAPKDNGKYDIYLEFADGELYYGKAKEKIFTFTIYQFDEIDWAAIQSICPVLTARGWSTPWDLSGGVSTASHLAGLTVKQGKVVGLDLSNASLNGIFPVELLILPHLNYLNLSGNNLEGAVESVAVSMQQNPAAGVNLTELDIANNSLSGNLGIMAACFPNITSIDARGNCLSDIYPMISEKVFNLNVSGQTIDRTVEYNLSNTSIEELARQIPTILLYDHVAQSYTKPLNLHCSMEDGFGMTLSYINGHIVISDVSEQNAYHGGSGDVLDVVALSGISSEANSTLKLKLFFEKGDANFINGLDITDLQSTILYAFGEYPSYLPFNFSAADTYNDNLINVQDVVCTANILLGMNNLQVPAQTRRSSKFQLEESEAYAYIYDGKLYLESTRPVAAIDLHVDGVIDWKLGEFGMDAVSTLTHLVAYSMSGMTLPTGSIVLGEVEEDAAILSCVLSDGEAQPIRVSTNLIPSGIDIQESSEGGDSLIYDLNGRRINSLGGGINIVVKCDGRQKTIIRKK